MSWIKRNLYFLLGGVVALGLMIAASVYLFAKWKQNEQVKSALEAQYAELDRLNKMTPHPGNERVDNIKAAEAQQEQLRTLIKRVRQHFKPVAAIPAAEKVTSEAFTASLRRTVDQLQRDAAAASVNLPPRYYFTFEAQKPLVRFAAGSLEPLSLQLGEIKAICDILFRARINSLDGLRRERVSSDDGQGLTDYLDKKSRTNDLANLNAVLTPYEVTFQCFSPELAKVMEGFANSQHGFIVRNVQIEPAPLVPQSFEPPVGAVPPPYGVGVTRVIPSQPGGTPAFRPQEAEMDVFAERYGIGAKGAPTPRTFTQQPVQVVRSLVGAPSPGGPGGLPTVINENPLKVTLLVEVVKLKSGK